VSCGELQRVLQCIAVSCRVCHPFDFYLNSTGQMCVAVSCRACCSVLQRVLQRVAAFNRHSFGFYWNAQIRECSSHSATHCNALQHMFVTADSNDD